MIVAECTTTTPGLREIRAQLEMLHAESFGWARLCCGQERLEAENVLQTVYLKILEGKAAYEGKSAFRTWLFGVIRNTAREMRRLRLLEAVSLRRLGTQPVNRPRLADQDMERQQAHEALHAALRSLPRRQAEALQLVFYHELTLAEAAAIMSVSIGSARRHYERGKKRLRTLLEHS